MESGCTNEKADGLFRYIFPVILEFVGKSNFLSLPIPQCTGCLPGMAGAPKNRRVVGVTCSPSSSGRRCPAGSVGFDGLQASRNREAVSGNSRPRNMAGKNRKGMASVFDSNRRRIPAAPGRGCMEPVYGSSRPGNNRGWWPIACIAVRNASHCRITRRRTHLAQGMAVGILPTRKSIGS